MSVKAHKAEKPLTYKAKSKIPTVDKVSIERQQTVEAGMANVDR